MGVERVHLFAWTCPVAWISGENGQGPRSSCSVPWHHPLTSSKLAPSVLFISVHHVLLTELAEWAQCAEQCKMEKREKEKAPFP